MGTRGTLFVFIFLSPFILTGISGTSPIIEDCVCSKPRCPANEEYRCQNSCPPETCITLYAAFDCIANQTCKPGCYCKKGFLRTTRNGTCVPPHQCLPLGCVNDPNAKKGCGIRCGRTCEDYNDKSKICPPAPCRRDGCECKDGFVYDWNVGLCVKPHKCTKQCTKPHERYSRCLLEECGPKTCNDLGKPLACPGIKGPCQGGCICEQGYVRDAKGNCVNAKTCPSCGGDPNAKTGCGNPCGKTCDSLNKTDLVCPQYCEVNGCDCKKGFALNTATKKCVRIKDCPKPPRVCPKNEEPGCRQPCPPETCITRYVAIDCIAGQKCVEGCYCKQGYLRNGLNGTCIPENDCLPLECANDPNAKKGCGNRCGKTCEDYNDKDKVCSKGPCTQDGCECKDGYVYDRNTGKCVKPNECTKQCTKLNERYTSCLLAGCGPKTCDQLGKPVACPSIAEPCLAGGCICKEGYVRDSKGNCIDKKNCPSCGGDPNAVSGCGNPCGKTCDSLNGPNKTVCPKYCNSNGCDCKEGFLLNTATKKCTPIKDCPNYKPKQCTKPHERYSKCLLGECVPKTCEDLRKPLACPAIAEPCAGGCICEEGYVRDSKGNCIDKTTCPKKCAENEEFYCGPSCPEASCKNPNPPKCINKKCELKCFCKKGFVRDARNRCIPANICPVDCNKPHERYIDCLSGQCLPKTCDDLGRSLSCPFIRGPCPGGCICENDYLRAANGTCIKQELCPPKPCGTNQTWVTSCNGYCPDSFCPRNDKPLPPCEPLLPCYPGCQCKLNYRLNATRSCILAPDCPAINCTRQNEVYDSCPSTCLAEDCEDINNQPTTCNTLIWLCSPRCVCAKGHFRNKEGLCVPASQCPKACPNPNEKYIDCLAGQCNPKTCDELINPAPCPRSRPPCPGGCICVDGYVRNAKGVCIKKEACRTNCTGPNEQYSDCANAQCTPITCKDIGLISKCPTVKKCTTGCICKRGYVRSKNGTCIAINDCPKAGKCDSKNATWVQCAVNCGPAYCPKNDHPQPICFPPAGLCSPGCICKENYRIDGNNKCILASDCAPVPCTRPNEKFSSCPPNGATLCSQRGKPVPKGGPKICNPACICKKGFYRNDTNICVPECDCPPRVCPPNEQPGCRKSCPPETCLSLYAFFRCVENQTCVEGCFCKPGYLRTSVNGTCIPKDQCQQPKQCTKPHERYSKCLLGECVPKTCEDLGKPLACPAIAEPCAGGCICEEGYVRDSKGNCIDKTTCPKKCAENEEFYCGPSCPEASCKNPIPPKCINKKCELKCFCKKGFVRDARNRCIPANTCPVDCNKPHERYIDCLSGQCLPKTCDDLGRSLACPFIRGPCPGGCICENNYLRAANGTCIKQELCPPKPCGTNQTWVTSCNGYCPDSFCPRNDKPLPPCKPLLPCYPGCQCKLNYRVNATGRCILAPDCPAINCTRQNEEYDSCPSACLAEDCEDINNQPSTCNTLIWLCSPRCVCAKGHFRNKEGLCVPASQCPKACPNPNEKYIDCLAGQCNPKTCDELINPAPCPRVRPPCPGGCICVDGYVRNAKGVCIKKEACPKKCKKPHERYSNCLLGECIPKNCEDLGRPIACPRIAGPCAGGCICEEGYVRDSKGNCIEKKSCPSVCKDPNAQWSDCKSPCPGTCQNTKPVCASKVCTAGCQCKEGYVLSKEGEKCVPIDTCADYVECAGNQTFRPCTFRCPQVMCPKSDQTILCKPPRDCPGGCGCKDNYRYNADDECILGSDCPPVECTRKNEVWYPCRSEYDYERCDDRYNSPPIVGDDNEYCNPRCSCIKGYYKNNNNECVPENKCPPIS